MRTNPHSGRVSVMNSERTQGGSLEIVEERLEKGMRVRFEEPKVGREEEGKSG